MISRLSFWGTMEAIFSLWTLSCDLSGTHNLSVLSLRHADSCIHLMQALFLEETIVRQIYLLFSFLTHIFCLFRCSESFPYCSLSESGSFKLTLVCFLLYPDCVWFVNHWGLMEATFSWNLSNALPWARKLRASNFESKDSCFHHLQTLF